jgi:hypothetical protein
MNSLGRYVHSEMAWRDWSLSDLAAHAGLAEDDLLPLFNAGPLADWPSSRVISALADALRVPSRELVLQAAEGCGLPVQAETVGAELVRASNAELLQELRRRLAMGADAGGHLSTSASCRRMSGAPRLQVG